MKPNSQYFVVRIDKQAQTERRNFLTMSTAAYLGIQSRTGHKDIQLRGVTIDQIDPEGPAAKAYFQSGDRILEINREAVNTMEELLAMVQSHPPGTEINITYLSRLATGAHPYPSHKLVKLGSKTTKLSLPEEANPMEYNLQYGEIVDMGGKASRDFPEARIGDILLFHHLVEYKPRETTDHVYNDWHLVHTDQSGDELRVVRQDSEVFGLIRPDEEELSRRITPYRNVIFCHPDVRKASFQKKSGLWLPDAWKHSDEAIATELAELNNQMKELQMHTELSNATTDANYKKKEEIIGVIGRLQQERLQLTKKMHQKQLCEAVVLFFNPEMADHLGDCLLPGDRILVDQRTLYPLEIAGVRYMLARQGFIEALLPNTKNSSMETKNPESIVKLNCRPLADRVIVLPDPKEEKSDGGIIIPDTVQEKPVRGTVVACGRGKKDQPPEVTVGDRVMYGKYAGTQIDIAGGDYLIMREDELLVVL